jgi:DNA polymerase I-like protein with 3'-5' exonuclease and polymerase domains
MYIESTWYSLNIDDFNDFKSALVRGADHTLVTFQTSDLMQHFKANAPIRIPNIVDLRSFDKQMSQEGKEFRENKKWNALLFLMHHKVIDSEFELKQSSFKIFLEYLAKLYINLLEKDDHERERFEKIELKINRLIYKAQLKGVRIDADIARRKCKEIEKNIFHLKNVLQLEHRIFVPESEKLQLDYLKSKGYNIIESPLYTFKIRRGDDKICKLFYELIRNEQDLDSLLYILSYWGRDERTYPTYFGFGTITSRIILHEPSLQNFRKVNRDVIIPDAGMKLLYIDYSQFEAGILASLSNDKALISLYNKDVYSDLAEKVLGNPENRSDAKIVFYRYMYGDSTLNKKALDYFKKFEKLNLYRQKIDTDMQTNRKVGTIMGNYRYCLDDENSWALSHSIQATASLIYKNALIRVSEEVKQAQFLIPMHDATLYQIDTLDYDEYKTKIEKIYIEEFKKICPQIEPKMYCKELFE